MNKYQEALDLLSNTIKDNLISFDDTEKKAIETLQELINKVNKWIPIEQRLPDEYGEYLVYYSYETDGSVREDKECGYWIVNFDTDMEAFGEWQDIYHPVSLGFLDSEFNEMNTVVAWMPLPEPYKRSDEE